MIRVVALLAQASPASAHEPKGEPRKEAPRPAKDPEKEQQAIEVTIHAEKPGSELASPSRKSAMPTLISIVPSAGSRSRNSR